MALDHDLSELLSEAQVLSRPIDRFAYASDASFYRLIPQVVVRPRTIDDVRRLFEYSRRQRIPMTFRAGGTSLSGQAVTDGILVDLSLDWRQITIGSDGETIRLQPGVVGSEANQALAKYARRIGPDPASIAAAQMGGMAANNASGMCCGVIENTYHTLVSMVYVLPNGVAIDTADSHADEMLRAQAPEIVSGLEHLKAQIRANAALCHRIRAKYRQKNTTGYSLNAFLDFDAPHQILAHLMIGSEGTLGFIAEVTLKTLPAYPHKATALLLFETVRAATDAVFALRDSGARAIEFMDRAALRSVENEPGMARLLSGIPDAAAALLVEYQSATAEELGPACQAAEQICGTLALLRPARFTTAPTEQALLWKIRKGLYPSIGGMRHPGTTVLIEDVAFRVEDLADATADLQALFVKHHFPEAIIFGHAKDGNLHFVLTPSFNDAGSVDQYAQFMQEVVELVVKKYGGALKAEHGTGRNVAPFVEAEWGREAYAIMAQLKQLVDPDNLLNPGVIINPDPQAHLKNLKTWPRVEDEVDKCIECGFCEPKCPSLTLTLTPRRRIVVRRELARLRETGADPELLASLTSDYDYAGLDTCAVDGYCALACPVHIDTGLLVKRLRAEKISAAENSLASRIARHFRLAEEGVRVAVGLGHLAEKALGVNGVVGLSRAAEVLAGSALPKWNGVVPQPNFSRFPQTSQQTATVVFFPSCLTRVMGAGLTPGQSTIIETVVMIAERAGQPVWIPPDSPGHCCGMPFSSKGYTQAFHEILHRTLERFWAWSEHGRLPIVIDSSSCAYTLLTCREHLSPADQARWEQLTLLDPSDYLYRLILPSLRVRRLPWSVTLHPNCSAVKLELHDKMAAVARACAESVTVPDSLGCCGFAGDRGLLFPELTAAASRAEASEVNQREFDGYYSSNLTCEMGMRQATGRPYQSIFYLVEAASRTE